MPPELPPTNFLDPYFFTVHVVMLFMLGACFGSFFNVCIYRIPMNVPLSLPPSHCYRCGRFIRWYDNIPLISYWVLGGKCRHCGASFSIRYFCVELLTALLFLAAFLKLGYTLALLPALVFLSLLIIATFTDIDHWIIPDRVSLGGMAAGLVLAAIPPVAWARGNPLAVHLFPVAEPLAPLANAAVGAAVGYGGLWLVGKLGTLLFRKDAMGVGDMKLMAMFGAFLGPEPLLHVLILACLVGTAAGLAGLARARLTRDRVVDPATAPLALSGEEVDALLARMPLDAAEARVVDAALRKPGVLGPVRHHLPFGPSLAVAAAIVYFYFPQLRALLERLVLPGPLVP
ncbi:MAG TPA: prepilin peptidase [Candidatus Sumerlaeota bacterium]|nr:MAG: Type 4 prepilin-like proteins leader peptide-processing enzyme [candidate division BRC1 bacterium ADurb.BinA292]HOE95890.1 prepilin peptidase [Candidatus Sumerlaeota bacterium]HOR28120.1 prepilin peptidase [Candidatus Sumerlaeota bacterium]HPK02192.1 prepilin peptidase [Candidatus Sumerlaeota bacterium]